MTTKHSLLLRHRILEIQSGRYTTLHELWEPKIREIPEAGAA
jgi:hypothetical protein